MAPLDQHHPAPAATVDSSANFLDQLMSERTVKVLGYGAGSAAAVDTAKLGIDAAVFRGYSPPGAANAWLRMNTTTLAPEVTSLAPKWVEPWVSKISPTAELANHAATSVRASAVDLAGQTTDFLRGAKLYTGEPAPATAMSEYLAAFRNPSLVINAKQPPLDVLKDVAANVGRIGGQAERVLVLDNLAALKQGVSVIDGPVLMSTRRTLTGSLMQGAAVAGGTYLADIGLSKLAASTYGNDSTVARVLAPTVLDSSLAAAGYAMGPTMQSKLALAATGWLCGKAVSWLQS